MIVIDIETTGVDPSKHALVSIGAVDFAHPDRQFYGECHIWDGAEVMDEALRVNGFTHTEIRDGAKKSCTDLLKDFLLWCEPCPDKTLVGVNAQFDYGFLVAAAQRCGIVLPFGYRLVDIHSVGCAQHLRQSHAIPLKQGRSHLTSEKLFWYVGLPSEPQPHNGLIGAKMAAETFSRLALGKGLLVEFQHYGIPEYLQ